MKNTFTFLIDMIFTISCLFLLNHPLKGSGILIRSAGALFILLSSSSVTGPRGANFSDDQMSYFERGYIR